MADEDPNLATTCRRCGATNAAGVAECRECGEPKPDERDPDVPAPEEETTEETPTPPDEGQPGSEPEASSAPDPETPAAPGEVTPEEG